MAWPVFESDDPLRESVRQLGRRWTLLLLRDMAFRRLRRFGEFLRSNPGLTPRVLSRRLMEMQREGLVRRTVSGRAVQYRLSARGEDAVFILLAFLRYGARRTRLLGHPAPSDPEKPGVDPPPGEPRATHPTPPASRRRRRKV